jgi:prolyl oligopeptidase
MADPQATAQETATPSTNPGMQSAIPAARPFPQSDAKQTFSYSDGTSVTIPDPGAAVRENSKPVLDWVAQENARAEQFLNRLESRKRFEQFVRELSGTETVAAPVPAGDFLFSRERKAGLDRPGLYLQSKDGGDKKLLFDPKSEGARITLDAFFPSPDGKFVIIGTSNAGTEETELKVLKTESREILPLKLSRCNWPSVAWLPDSTGFYFTQYPARGAVSDEDARYDRRIFLQKLDGSEKTELPVYKAGREDFPFVARTKGSSWIAYGIGRGAGANSLIMRSIESGKELKIALLETSQDSYQPISSRRGFGVLTDSGAKRGRYVEYRLKGDETSLPVATEVLPEQKSKTLTAVVAVHDNLVALYSNNLISELTVFDSKGKKIRDIKLPGVGTVSALTASEDEKSVFYQFTSFAHPTEVFRADIATGKSFSWAKGDLKNEPESSVVKQVIATSKDGTKVPAFVIAPKGVKLDGSAPTILYGYGGFNRGFTPAYNSMTAAWVKAGGVFVFANLRGGGEFGSEWHDQGTKERKQNVFDDYSAIADELVKKRVASKKTLAALGGSNGGLLTAVAANQYGEKFAAIVSQVPLTNMLRYDLSKIGELWKPELGSASNSKSEFDYLHAYSPVHNVRLDRSYPPMLITNSENDPRTDPTHAREFYSILVDYSLKSDKSQGPFFLRTNFNQGHGTSSREELTARTADTLAFIWHYTRPSVPTVKGGR